MDSDSTSGERSLYEAIGDAIWQALDAEQAMPHSGVDPAFVIPEFLRLLDSAGYTVVHKNLAEVIAAMHQERRLGVSDRHRHQSG